MKEKNILIFLTVMVFTIIKYVKLNKGNVNISNMNIVQENITSNDVQLDDNETGEENIDYDNTDYIFEHEEETGEENYTREHLKEFNFNIDNIPSDITQYINNMEEFNNRIKEYVYLNGLVDASYAKYDKYEINDGEILIIYNLNNQEKSNL